MKKSIVTLCLLSFIAGSVWAKHYPDSVMAVSNQEERIEKGWNFEFYGGAGVGRYEFQQLGVQHTPAHSRTNLTYPTWNAGLSINYYFLPYMGLGIGAEYHNYVNSVEVINPWTVTRQDYQNDEYTLTATPIDIREKEQIGMLEIPVALRFRAIPNKVGFIGSLGLKFGFPVTNSYQLQPNGRIENVVEYPHWNWTWSNVPGVIEDVNLTTNKNAYTTLRKVNYAAFAEIGVLVQLSQRVDLALSAFGSYYFIDVMASHPANELSFASEYAPSEYIEPPFTGDYAGVLATNEVQQLHPWSAGLKIGLHINANRTKAQREYDNWYANSEYQYNFEDDGFDYGNYVDTIPAEDTISAEEIASTEEIIPEEETIPTEETVQTEESSATANRIHTQASTVAEEPLTRDEALRRIQQLARENDIDVCANCESQTIVIHDTIIQYVQQLDEMLSTSVIFFNLDDTEPILEPENILVNIANTLKAHPTMRVLINGHACKLGYPAYNKRLALRRAEAIAARLRELGVKDDQMTIRSLGSKHPFRYNGLHTLSKDRRVEIIPEGIGYPAETTERVIPGSRLAQIARRHYGEPEYWVFIYEANRKKLSNPDDIQIGTELIIPDLSRRLNGMSKEQVLAEVARLKAKMRTKKK